MKRKIVGAGSFLLVAGIVVLVLSVVDVPITSADPFQVPKSSDILNESFKVSPREFTARMESLDAGNEISVQFSTLWGTSINFFIVDETNYNKWQSGGTDAEVFMIREGVTTIDEDWTVPSTSDWYFIFDNTMHVSAVANISTHITKQWTETEYQQVTQYRPILSPEYSYLGVIFLLVGVAVIMSGLVAKEKE